MSDSETKICKILLSLLGEIEISPYRFLLDTGNVKATVPMIRGVWGKSLRKLDSAAYIRVFEGKSISAPKGREQTPLYMFNPSPPDPNFSPAIDWTLIGQAHDFENSLIKALDCASKMGLGPKRVPFSIPKILWLTKQSTLAQQKQRWSIREVAEEMCGKYLEKDSIQLRFSSPLRLVREGKLIVQPSFADIAIATTRRILSLAQLPNESESREILKCVTKLASEIPSKQWLGERTDFVRWSGSQKKEIDLHGVTGSLELTNGVGDLWPLLIAGSWIHLGKGTVFGLGKLVVET